VGLEKFGDPNQLSIVSTGQILVVAMENELGNVETDSVADLVLHVRGVVDPQWTTPLTMSGIRSWREALTRCQWDPGLTQACVRPLPLIQAEGFMPFADPTVIQPSVALDLEAMANCYGAEQSAMDPSGVMHFGRSAFIGIRSHVCGPRWRTRKGVGRFCGPVLGSTVVRVSGNVKLGWFYAHDDGCPNQYNLNSDFHISG